MPSWYSLTASQTEATLRYTSLAGSSLDTRKVAGSFGSAEMYQRNTWCRGATSSPLEPSQDLFWQRRIEVVRDREGPGAKTERSWTRLGGDLTSGVNRNDLPILGAKPTRETLSLYDGVQWYPSATAIAESLAVRRTARRQ